MWKLIKQWKKNIFLYDSVIYIQQFKFSQYCHRKNKLHNIKLIIMLHLHNKYRFQNTVTLCMITLEGTNTVNILHFLYKFIFYEKL